MTGEATTTAVMRIATRGSALALAQAALVARALDAHGVGHETIIVETAGDRRALDTAWGEGAFVSALEDALLESRADLAVHSAKDIPTDEDPRLAIAAYLPREEPRDALVLPAGVDCTLDTLPAGTVIGTDSPRRTGFVLARRPDLVVRPLHGNVDTRLRRLDEGVVGALVLAAAGLMRLGRAERITQLLPTEVVPPAPGQGAIAVQVRERDRRTAAHVQGIDDPATRAEVETERLFLAATGGGCRAPVGALARSHDGTVELVAGMATLDGRTTLMRDASAMWGEHLEMAARLALEMGEARSRALGGPRVLLTRPQEGSQRLAARLADLGIGAWVVPTISVELLEVAPDVLDGYDLVVVTSANAVRALAHQPGAVARARWAAVGRTTARELRSLGATDIWMPSAASAAAVAQELPVAHGQRILRLRGELADSGVSDGLRARGAHVDELTVYRTVVAPDASRPLLDAALSGGAPAAVVLGSPSAVRGLLGLAPENQRPALLRVPAIALGPTTTAAARLAGFATVASAATPDPDAVAVLVAETLKREGA